MNIGRCNVYYSTNNSENGTEEIPTWERFNEFKIVDNGPVQNGAEKRKIDDDGLVVAPMKKMKLG